MPHPLQLQHANGNQETVANDHRQQKTVRLWQFPKEPFLFCHHYVEERVGLTGLPLRGGPAMGTVSANQHDEQNPVF